MATLHEDEVPEFSFGIASHGDEILRFQGIRIIRTLVTHSALLSPPPHTD